MSDLKTNEKIKKQKFLELVWDKKYFKALEFFKTHKNEVIFDKWEVHRLAEGMHELGYYQKSYELHEMIFKNNPDQTEINFYERLNESWIKIMVWTMISIVNTFMVTIWAEHLKKL